MNQHDGGESANSPPPDSKIPEGLEAYLLSESALAKDWLSAEEDEA